MLFFFIFYYYFFKNAIVREPIFYFYNNKIIFTEEKFNFLISNKIYNKIDIPENRVIIETHNKAKYVITKKEYNLWDFINTFYLFIFISTLSLIFSIWFYEYFQDLFFSIFFLLKATLIFCILLSLYYPDNHLYFILWSIVATLFINSYINLNIRFLGKSINTFTLLIESFIFGLILMILLVEDIPKKKQFLFELFNQTFILAFLIFIIMNIVRIFKKDLDKIDKYKVLSYVIGNIIGFLPLIMILNGYKFNIFVYLIFSSIYPFFISYSLFRMYLVPGQIIITKTLITGSITIFFIILYFSSIYIYSSYFPKHFYNLKVYFDLLFLVILSLVIDPLRQKIFDLIKNKLLIPEKKYIISLMKLSNILSRVSRPNLAIEQFLNEIKNTLQIEKCLFLFVPDVLPNIDLNPQIAMHLDNSNLIWKYIKPEKIIATMYIVYSTGNRKKLFEFLYKNQIFLLFGLGEKEDLYYIIYFYILKFINFFYKIFKKEDISIYKNYLEIQTSKSALLIGKPIGRNKLDLKEIRYLQEVSRLATMLIKNMNILFKEVDKRKKIRYILQSGKFQKKISLHTKKFPDGVSIQYFNQPVLSVSGDYIDIIPISNNKIAVFLGDVSGHGLGTGYLVNAVRSIVHYCLEKNKSLKEIINTINIFLIDRYKGYEFLTLFSFILEIPTGKIEFINAAHPGIFIKPKDEPLQKIEKTQKLLGLSPESYQTYQFSIKPETKIFLFSDGVIETTNKKMEFFGEERLSNFINENYSLSVQEITKKLLQTLEEFRESKEFQDDTTFLAMEYNPPKNLFEILINNLLKLAR